MVKQWISSDDVRYAQDLLSLSSANLKRMEKGLAEIPKVHTHWAAIVHHLEQSEKLTSHRAADVERAITLSKLQSKPKSKKRD